MYNNKNVKIMKKNLFLAALAFVAVASCTSDDFVGENTPPTTCNQADAIQFTSEAPRITRTTAEDAAKLNYQFKVFGVKTVGTSDQRVFATNTSGVAPYDVWFDGASSGNTTTSNSSNWEYVGGVGEHGTASFKVTLNTEQTIKYWDYSASEYNFQAWSDVNTGTGNSVSVSEITKNTMTISGTPAQLANFYLADLQTIVQSNNSTTTAVNAYGGIVQLTFRKAATKVRLGIYETIPGYVVKDIKFYYASKASNSTTNAILDGKFVGNSTDSKEFTVSYGSDAPKKAILTPTGTSSNTTYFDFGTFTSSADIGIGTSSTSPTWASADNSTNNYINVLPNTATANIAPMLLYVDYTLYNSISGETINVKGAKAAVPAAYMIWNPNYAYTYLFKISDNTNGTTGPTVGTSPEGLYPITFDAIIAATDDGGTQGTITTVSTPSITTYQAGSVTDNGIEYKTGTPIYLTVEDQATGALKTLTDGGSAMGAVQVYSLGTTAKTEADMQFETFSSESDQFTLGATATTVNGITLPANQHGSFTPTTAGYYAIQYLTTEAGTEPVTPAAYTYKVVKVVAASGS